MDTYKLLLGKLLHHILHAKESHHLLRSGMNPDVVFATFYIEYVTKVDFHILVVGLYEHIVGHFLLFRLNPFLGCPGEFQVIPHPVSAVRKRSNEIGLSR